MITKIQMESCMIPVSCLFEQCEFHFLPLHIYKTGKGCLLINNGHVPGIAKWTKWQCKA